MVRRAWLLLLLLGAIWGASYLFIKIGLRDLSPGMVAWLRVLLAALVLVPLASRQGGLRRSARDAAGPLPAGRRAGGGPVHADRGRGGGDLLLAGRDPRLLGAAVHGAAGDLGRPRGALDRHARRRDRRSASPASCCCSASTSAARARRCSGARRSCSPASATRSAASSPSTASPTPSRSRSPPR